MTHRDLYKSLQADIGDTPNGVRLYLDRLERAHKQFVALREPDDQSWSAQAIDVKDSLLAFRRFGFEVNIPLLLSAFANWSHSDATRFVDIVANWSVRAWVAGLLGGGVAESAFCDAAVAIANKSATDAAAVKPYMKDLIPDDKAFKEFFKGMGGLTTTKAKYFLGQLELQFRSRSGLSLDSAPDWSSKSITVEHIFAKSSKVTSFASQEDFDQFTLMKDQLKNLTLLEKKLNSDLEDKAFAAKVSTYANSVFSLTKELGSLASWDLDEANRRAEFLAELAVDAWPM